MRILGSHLEFIPGDLGDSRFINYLLEHGYCWLSGKTDSFWSAHFMHPFPNTIALSDSMIGTQLFYFPWRMLGFEAETSYQLWWVCICSLNFWVSYWVFNRIFENKLLAALLAWTFAFSILNLGQLNYMQMIIRFPVAIAFYSAYRFCSTFSLKYLSLYCFSLVYQFYCVPYTGFYLFYFSILFVFVFLFFSKRIRQFFIWYFHRDIIIRTLVVFFVSGTFLMILLWPYYVMSDSVGLRMYHEVLPNVPMLQSYVLAHESSISWNFLFDLAHRGITEWWLHFVFPGMLLLLTLLGSVGFLLYKMWRKAEVNLFLISLIVVSAIFCLLHMRIGNDYSLYGLIFKLPGINSIRVPNRFMQVELFLLLVVFGFFVRQFNGRLLVLFLGLVFMDNSFDSSKVMRTVKSDLIQRRERLKNLVLNHKDFRKQPFALVDTINPVHPSHLDAMFVAQELGIPTLNGYSSYCPNAFGQFFNTCSEPGLLNWMLDQRMDANRVLIIYRHDEY